jgi:hypothetical protein
MNDVEPVIKIFCRAEIHRVRHAAPLRMTCCSDMRLPSG